ncbi:MAG TPA: ABC transporter permease [Nitrospirae bacterium]|nr:cell division protein FtsX [bacterium BMS3Abin06]HDH12753.1 ABC transporter permease [Nitrospirota bacterium]HDZ00062.1 ABC transporter permease [Nitrospirota bacterium]
MKIFRYAFQTVFKSLWREKWINLLTILSISIGLSLLTSFIMITLNMDSVLQRWAKNFGIVVYLDEDINKAEENTLKNRFLKDKDIIEVKYISKEKALKELHKTLGANALVLEGLDENPLPSSFELRLKSSLIEPGLVKNKAAQIERISGVDEVQYGEKWLSSLYAVSKTMKLGAIIIGGAIFIAITFITYSTIKIFFYRRKEEIETLKLLGATRSFIRLPFLLEGLIIGLLGGIMSSLVIFGIYSFTSLKMVEFLPSINLVMASLPFQVYLIVPLAGAVVSIVGSFIAVGKIRY